jgi:hypothetical protein
VVTGRVILTGPAATQLLQSLHKLATPNEAAQKPVPEPN